MTAFPKPAPPRKRRPNPGHPFLAWLKAQACCSCGATPSEAAHVKGPLSLKTKIQLNRRQGEAYLSAVPLCAACHRTGVNSVHEEGEKRFAADRLGHMESLARLAHAYLARWILEGRP